MIDWVHLTAAERYERVRRLWEFMIDYTGKQPSGKMIAGVIRSASKSQAIGGLAKITEMLQIAGLAGGLDRMIDVTEAVLPPADISSRVRALVVVTPIDEAGSLITPIVITIDGTPSGVIRERTLLVDARVTLRRKTRRALRRHASKGVR